MYYKKCAQIHNKYNFKYKNKQNKTSTGMHT